MMTQQEWEDIGIRANYKYELFCMGHFEHFKVSGPEDPDRHWLMGYHTHYNSYSYLAFYLDAEAASRAATILTLGNPR